jgi:hypothetical protein
MTANELFAAMPVTLATRVIDEVHASDKDLYRVALHSVAQARKVRPIFLERQPKTDRHRAMAAALSRTDLRTVAGNLISGWLVKNQGALLTDFLDTLKIKHEKGVVDNLPSTVPDADLDAAINALLAKYERQVVVLYLHAFNGMNEAGWAGLDSRLHEDERLVW